MKNFKKVLALVLAVAMLMSFATVASAENKTSEVYGDAADINYVEAVDVLTAIGVIDGISGDFKPADTLTRAQAAKIIAMFDNGDTEINKLYAAANPFTDVAKGSWAESFIAYCYKMGIVGGIGNNLFAPNAEVTGIQYLKMVLCVLGYDAKEEGLEGTSWAVNTLALAKDAGLLETLGRRYDYEAPLSREAAVQIMLNALLADCVEYGYNVKRNETYYTIAGAIGVEAGNDDTNGDDVLQLFEAWELECEYGEDAYGRPARHWTYGRDEIGVGYTEAADFVYTEAVLGCDVYDETGLAEGEYVSHDIAATGSDRETLEFVLVDSDDEDDAIGATGVRTEIYIDEETDAVEVFFIHTYLAEVVDVKNARYDSKGHEQSAARLELEVYVNEDNDDSIIVEAERVDLWEEDFEGFEEEDMVLVTFNARGNAVVTVMDAEDEVVTFNRLGRDEATMTIDGEVTPISFDMNYGQDVIDEPEDYVGEDITVYYDEYGNVIGCDLYDEAGAYAMISAMWVDYVRGDALLKADLVFANGDEMEEVEIEEVDLSEVVGDNAVETEIDYSYIANSDQWEANDANEFGEASVVAADLDLVDGVYDILYRYSVDEDDVYSLDAVEPTAESENGRQEIKTAASRIKVPAADGEYYKLTDDTAFMVEEEAAPRGEYDVFAGNDGLTACEAEVRVYDFDDDGIADIVILDNVLDRGSAAIAWFNGTNANFTYVENLRDEDGDHYIYEVDLFVLSEDGTTFEVDTYTFDNGEDKIRDVNNFINAWEADNMGGLFNCFIDEDGYIVVDDLDNDVIAGQLISAADEDGEFFEIVLDGEDYEVELDEVEVWAFIDGEEELVENDYDLYEGYPVVYVLDEEGEVSVVVVLLDAVVFVHDDDTICNHVEFAHDDVFAGREVTDEEFTLEVDEDVTPTNFEMDGATVEYDADDEALTITGVISGPIVVTH